MSKTQITTAAIQISMGNVVARMEALTLESTWVAPVGYSEWMAMNFDFEAAWSEADEREWFFEMYNTHGREWLEGNQ